jgi:bacteriocin-like protein
MDNNKKHENSKKKLNLQKLSNEEMKQLTDEEIKNIYGGFRRVARN